MLKHQDLQMLGLKLKRYEGFYLFEVMDGSSEILN